MEIVHEVRIALTENAAQEEMRTTEGLITAADKACMVGNLPELSDLVVFLMFDCGQGHYASYENEIAFLARCPGRPGSSNDLK